MARRPDKGQYVPKNPQKYIGANLDRITYRSSWELTMQQFLDNTPEILQWASESVHVPYQNPLTGKWSIYIPDFLVVYLDKNGRQHCEMIEIKPAKEVPGMQVLNENGRPRRISPRDRLTQAVNAAKWQAALAYCAKRGWQFRVATEHQMFAWKRKK